MTVWRELRRLRDQVLTDRRMDAVLAAADVGDWAAYTQAQGGAPVARRDLVVRLVYEITEQGNEYAEDVQRVQVFILLWFQIQRSAPVWLSGRRLRS